MEPFGYNNEQESCRVCNLKIIVLVRLRRVRVNSCLRLKVQTAVTGNNMLNNLIVYPSHCGIRVLQTPIAVR